MDLRQLEALKLIGTTGSFSSAAEQLGLTQSALSHQIRNLEEEVGEQLLVRARPRIYPTAAGQRLLISAERIFIELASIKEQFARTPGEAGSVRVAATPVAITYLYGDLLEHFIARHPGIELIFHATETTENPVQRVLQRDSDVGFTVLPQKHPKIEVTQLGRAEQVLIVGATHPLAKQQVVSIEKIRQWPFVRFEPKTGARLVSDSVFMPSGGYPPILAESNDVEYVKRIIRMGLGVSLVPVFCVRNELDRGTLRALRLRSGRIMQDFGLVCRADVSIRALDMFKKECLALRGPGLRTITLERLDEPLFGKVE